jgi:secreted trypsin-like serine protease
MKKHLVVLAFMSAAAASISTYATSADKQSSKQTRIIGGIESKAKQYPFMTGLVDRNAEGISTYCGASFIGKRYVLTASHCVVGTLAEDTAVWIGGYDTTKPDGGRKVNVAQIYLHEEYDNENTNNDIAIIELVEDVQGVTPIKLITPEIEATLKDGHMFTVMGWGNRNAGDVEGDFPNILHEVNVPLYNFETCKKNYTAEGETESGVNDNMFCAGLAEGSKDSCQGDSGGPLVFQHNDEWYQAGVVSFGDGCAVANKPGVYSRVSKYNTWVTQKRAGVSYLQTKRNGYVEKEFDEVLAFNIKNVAQSEFSVIAATIIDQKNLAAVEIASNQCDGKNLTFEQSCDINVKVKADRIGEGSFNLKVTNSNQLNSEVTLAYNMNTLEPETLDMPTLVESDAEKVKWYGGGDARWQAQTVKKAKGDNAIASGDIADMQTSVLLATVSGDLASKLSLKYLVSSEERYDPMIVRLNNNEIFRASGTDQTEFNDLPIELGAGTNRIAITYEKDQSDANGDDKAYVDSISLEIKNRAPVAKVKQASITIEEGKQFTLDAADSTDPDKDEMTYLWIQISGSTATIASADKVMTEVTAPTVTADTNLSFIVTVTDKSGLSSEATVVVKVTNKPAPAPSPVKPTKKSGGSFGGLLTVLVVVLLIGYRRKNTA